MEARAQSKYVRIAPRKARLVMDAIRGKDYQDALNILRFTPKASAPIIEKILRSAAANAQNNYDMDVDALYISQCFVDEGPIMKRFRPRAMGRAGMIRKRTSHITIVLKEKEG